MDQRTAFIHHYLNDLHEKAVWIRVQLRAKGVPARLFYERERTILMDGARRRQSYPTPCLRIDEDTEIGVNLDGVFFDFWCDRSSLDFQRTMDGLSRAFERVEAYCPVGYTPIYGPGQDVRDAAAAAGQCSESIIAFTVYLEHDAANVADSFITAREIVREGLQSAGTEPDCRANSQ